jgi:hypothetical protein
MFATEGQKRLKDDDAPHSPTAGVLSFGKPVEVGSDTCSDID